MAGDAGDGSTAVAEGDEYDESDEGHELTKADEGYEDDEGDEGDEGLIRQSRSRSDRRQGAAVADRVATEVPFGAKWLKLN